MLSQFFSSKKLALSITATGVVVSIQAKPAQAYDFDFETFNPSNPGFQTDYIYDPSSLGQGDYAVGTNPQNFNRAFASIEDRTPTGDGNMMVVDGSTTSDRNVWQQTIPVTPNTDYEFSAFAANVVNTSPAELQFKINDNVVGSPLDLPLNNDWNELTTIWNSGSNTSVTLGIVDNNIEAIGNDFALDDISSSVIPPTPVPFEASPTSGIFILGGLVGISRLRKKLAVK